jgi:hypothetical protein
VPGSRVLGPEGFFIVGVAISGLCGTDATFWAVEKRARER